MSVCSVSIWLTAKERPLVLLVGLAVKLIEIVLGDMLLCSPV